MEARGQLHAPAALSPGERLPIAYETGLTVESVWMLYIRLPSSSEYNLIYKKQEK
jgi:hypothetical protein